MPTKKPSKFSDDILPGTFVTTMCAGRCNSVQLHTEHVTDIYRQSGLERKDYGISYTCQVCGSVKVTK